MFVPVNCSQCSRAFQVPEAAVGKPTVCPWCQATVLALPVGEQPPPENTLPPSHEMTGKNSNVAVGRELKQAVLPLPADPEPLPAIEPLSLDETPAPEVEGTGVAEIPNPASAKSSRGRIALVLFGLILAIVTSAITIMALRYQQGYLASMEWQAFTAPDGSCEIDLLGGAKETDSDPEHGERRYLSQGWYSGTKAWIGWRNLTPAQVREAEAEKGWVQLREAIFDPERDRLKGKFGGYIARDATVGQSPLTVELRLDGPSGPVIERMIVISTGSHPRAYFIGMAGKRVNLDGPVVKRLFDSFRVHD